MKQKLNYIPLMLAAIFMIGCSTFQSNAGKTIAATAATVDAAMKGWAASVHQGLTNPQQEVQVKQMYVTYQTAMHAAALAYAQAQTTKSDVDKQTLTVALSEVEKNKTVLLTSLGNFNKKGSLQ